MGGICAAAGKRNISAAPHGKPSIGFTFAGALLLALTTSPALAAPENVSGQGKFYVRADLGASIGDNTNGDFIDAQGVTDVVEFDFGTSPVFRAGLGYQWNRYLRTDLTIAHRTDLGGSHTIVNGQDGVRSPIEADLTSTSAFLNLYLDLSKLGNWNLGQFAPYLGAGIGWAMNDLDDGFLPPTQQRLDGSENHNFAYRLTAGTGYSLTDQLVLDVAYSYVDLGEAVGNEKITLLTTGQVGFIQRGIEVDLRAHEIMLGLRYSF